MIKIRRIMLSYIYRYVVKLFFVCNNYLCSCFHIDHHFLFQSITP